VVTNAGKHGATFPHFPLEVQGFVPAETQQVGNPSVLLNIARHFAELLQAVTNFAVRASTLCVVQHEYVCGSDVMVTPRQWSGLLTYWSIANLSKPTFRKWWPHVSNNPALHSLGFIDIGAGTYALGEISYDRATSQQGFGARWVQTVAEDYKTCSQTWQQQYMRIRISRIGNPIELIVYIIKQSRADLNQTNRFVDKARIRILRIRSPFELHCKTIQGRLESNQSIC
jgi:hypothetical protein